MNECRDITKEAYKNLTPAHDKNTHLKNYEQLEKKPSYEQNASEANSIEIFDIAVSYDGSWPTRGHKSKHGFGCVIDLLTGYVLDFDVASKFCRVCASAADALGEDSPDFQFWFEGHKDKCDINHGGSSGAMEITVAEKIWKRSIDYGFRLTTMLSDGDCKTFNHLQQLKIYGSNYELVKEECINHVGKRYEI